MSRAKRHHQVAQTYLKNFADANGRVVVYDRVERITLPRQHVRDVAVESDLYTFVDATGNVSDSFEQGPLARADGLAARLLPRLIEPNPQLSTRDRVAVDMFITLQYLRTRASHTFLVDSIDLALRSEIEKNVGGASPERIERFIEERYPQASEKEREELRRIAIDPSQPVSFETLDWLGAITENLSPIADFVITRPWVFLQPEGDAFLSCDNPIVLIGPQPLGLGTAPIIFWPLSPNKALMRPAVASADRKRFVTRSANHDLVMALNQLTANQATRQVYWHPETNPGASIALPVGPLLRDVSGIAVAPGERSYDKLREKRRAERARRYITKRK